MACEDLPPPSAHTLASVIVFGIALALLIVAVVRTVRPFGPSANTPVIDLVSAAPDRLSFGDVFEDRQFRWSLPITNNSDSELLADQITASCTCSKIEPASFTLKPSETREIHLTIDLTRKTPGAGSLDEFELRVQPTIKRSHGSIQQPAWTLRGRVRSAYRVDPPLVHFGEQSFDGQPFPDRTFVVEGKSPLNDLEVARSPEGFHVSRHPPRDGPNRFGFLVKTTEIQSLGPIDAEVTLRPKSTLHPDYPDLNVQFTGEVVEDVQTIPKRVEFGPCYLGELKKETISVYSMTERAFTIVSWRVIGDGLSVERDARQQGKIIVSQTAKSAGQQSGDIFFRIRSNSTREFTIRLPIAYIGLGTKDKN